jgi:hypothetical protein
MEDGGCAWFVCFPNKYIVTYRFPPTDQNPEGIVKSEEVPKDFYYNIQVGSSATYDDIRHSIIHP